MEYQLEIINGLIGQKIPVVSSASDGSATERSMQSKLAASATGTRTYMIKHPHPPNAASDWITTSIPLFRGQPVVMIQDSKHAAKTARNNVTTGAKFLVLGNYVAMYSQVRKPALARKGPLYKRDVEKVDRQDDNAACRLLSSATLGWLKAHHDANPANEEVRGLIIFLFLMGEAVDAYQNRSLPHIERVKMVLRLHFFLEHWESFLEHAGYTKSTNFISWQFRDILCYLVFGLIQLIIVYRDNYRSRYPLLPWLHSTEVCEHVFGVLRSLVKDFTMLDFFNLVPKLFLRLRLFTQSTVQASGKETASGYAHTFSDCRGIDLSALSAFPTDEQINQAAKDAYDEAENLIFILGISPDLLMDPPTNVPAPMSPTNGDDLEEDGYESESETNGQAEINDLYNCIENLGRSTLSSGRQDQMRDLGYASTMLSVHQDIEM